MRALRTAAIAALLTACAEPAPALEGLVVDALDGRPIAGALIIARGARTLTDASGRFALPVAGGPIHASAPEHLGLARRRLEAGPITLRLWPRDPPETAIDAHFARIAARRALRDDPDDPALRPAARAYLRGEPLPAIEGDVGAVRAELDAPPTVIRIWRRGIDGSTDSCAGRVDAIPFEDYVAGVLPHEWIPSWHDESLRAGSLAIRTYAWGWVARGGKYDCADLDDTARSQVYDDDRNERASAAVFATTGMAITVDGVLASGEYSAENGNPTATGVDDPLCDGRELFGHGRGMCQWGSQRWALDGRDHLWIATHYYPGSAVEGGAPAADDYASRAVLPIDGPAELVAGVRAPVTVRFENVGRREWTSEGTRLVAADAEPSPFFDDASWIDAATATAPDAYRYAPGAIGEYTFQITAPLVTEPREVTDELGLAHAGVGPFGERITLSVRVIPREGSVPPPPSGLDAGGVAPPIDPPPMEETSGGCAAAPRRGGSHVVLALLALLLTAGRDTSKKRSRSCRRPNDAARHLALPGPRQISNNHGRSRVHPYSTWHASRARKLPISPIVSLDPLSQRTGSHTERTTPGHAPTSSTMRREGHASSNGPLHNGVSGRAISGRDRTASISPRSPGAGRESPGIPAIAFTMMWREPTLASPCR